MSIYCLAVDSQNVGLSLGVNHVPLVTDYEAQGIRTVRPINEWIMPKGNRLTAFVYWPDNKPFTPGEARVEAKLFIAQPGSSPPAPGVVLTEFRWPAPEVPEAYPHTVDQPIDIDSPPEARLWEDAAVIGELKEADRAAVLQRVAELRRTLMTKDPNAVLDFARYKWEDDARAYDRDQDAVMTAAVDQYEMMTDADDLAIEELEREDAQFDIVANKRCVFVSRRGVERPIVISGDGMRFKIPTYFSKIDGNWKLVR